MGFVCKDDFEDHFFSDLICTREGVSISACAHPYRDSILYSVWDPATRSHSDHGTLDEAIVRFNEILGHEDRHASL